MLNKKMEITLGGEVRQLWFNNYAAFELREMFGVDQAGILQAVIERSKENYLLLLADLIKVGLKGHSLAMNGTTPEIVDKVNMLVADADINELMKVWEVFFDTIGGNVKQEPDKKKATKKPSARKKS